ncbi:MAG: tRNA (adenosine(37)-N6)-dimethylallyltransferase MiaA [Nitrospirae bacterium]|nr:tRNA (adenosine(37)-N6)-dimethylallyltransferase MiaA [Nitrospirota bacterium]
MQDKIVIIILGPTAVGKTGVSLKLAKALGTEIISADSMQIYRHMDIGTAKPSPDELKEVPHHLINILSPDQPFSAGMFKEKAVQIIDGLHSMNKIPIIAGGTGLYIRSLTRGLFDGPPADWPLRERLKEEEKTFGKGHLHKYLSSIDPEAAARISPNDLRRTIRAIEVSAGGDKTISEFQKAETKPAMYNFIKIGLSRDRKELYGLIEARIDTMIERGLLHETQDLLKMDPDRTALQALGYKEMTQHINGQIGFEEAVRLLKKHTKMYAKRQVTWFKKEPDINWVDITGIMEPDRIFEKVISNVEILKKLIYS